MTPDGQVLREAIAAALAGDDVALDEALERFAGSIALRVAARIDEPPRSRQAGWLTTQAAADYLDMSVAALHKLTAARAVPFEQEGPGCRCYFDRAALDEWQRAGRPRTIRLEAA